jgi:cell wall-associated NlpC family hydrolase
MTTASKPFGSFLACALILPTILTTVCTRGFDTQDFVPSVNAVHMNSIASIVSFPTSASALPDLMTTALETAAFAGRDIATSAVTGGTSAVTADSETIISPDTVIATEPAVEAVYPGSDPVVISDIRATLISADNRPCLWEGQEIASYALQYDGYKYSYGSASPAAGFDCSGFAYYVYGQFGYALPRTAHRQYSEGTAVSKEELRPGDLVFFTTDGSGDVSHVGIYVGGNQFINATTTGKGVKICGFDNAYWSKAYIGAKRIVTDESACRNDASAPQPGA